MSNDHKELLTTAENNFYKGLHEVNEVSLFVGDQAGHPELNFIKEIYGIGGSSIEGETALVGGALGGGFENTFQLHVMNCNEAMKQ